MVSLLAACRQEFSLTPHDRDLVEGSAARVVNLLGVYGKNVRDGRWTLAGTKEFFSEMQQAVESIYGVGDFITQRAGAYAVPVIIVDSVNRCANGAMAQFQRDFFRHSKKSQAPALVEGEARIMYPLPQAHHIHPWVRMFWDLGYSNDAMYHHIPRVATLSGGLSSEERFENFLKHKDDRPPEDPYAARIEKAFSEAEEFVRRRTNPTSAEREADANAKNIMDANAGRFGEILDRLIQRGDAYRTKGVPQTFADMEEEISRIWNATRGCDGRTKEVVSHKILVDVEQTRVHVKCHTNKTFGSTARLTTGAIIPQASVNEPWDEFPWLDVYAHAARIGVLHANEFYSSTADLMCVLVGCNEWAALGDLGMGRVNHWKSIRESTDSRFLGKEEEVGQALETVGKIVAGKYNEMLLDVWAPQRPLTYDEHADAFKALLEKYGAGTMGFENVERFRYQGPIRNKQDVARAMDEEAPVYIGWRANPPMEAEVMKIILRNLELGGNEKILSVGSGPGLYETYLAKEALREGGGIIGIDMSPKLVRTAQEISEKERVSNTQFRLHDAERLSAMPERGFSHAISIAALHWMPDYKAVVDGVARRLEPNTGQHPKKFIVTHAPETAQKLWGRTNEQLTEAIEEHFNILQRGKVTIPPRGPQVEGEAGEMLKQMYGRSQEYLVCELL